MNRKVSHQAGTFTCPQGFVESKPDGFFELGEDDELCLIRTPWDFNIGLLHGKKIPLSGSIVVQDLDERCFECTTLDNSQTNLAHISALIPTTSGIGQIVQVPKSFQKQLVISETIQLPDFEGLNEDEKQQLIQIPDGLHQRFLPFGFEQPVVSEKGPKKSPKRSSKESFSKSRHHQKRLTGSKRERKSVSNLKIEEELPLDFTVGLQESSRLSRKKKDHIGSESNNKQNENELFQIERLPNSNHSADVKKKIKKSSSQGSSEIDTASDSFKSPKKHKTKLSVFGSLSSEPNRTNSGSASTDITKKIKKHSSQESSEINTGSDSFNSPKKHKVKRSVSQLLLLNMETFTETPRKKKKHSVNDSRVPEEVEETSHRISSKGHKKRCSQTLIKQEVTSEVETTQTSPRKSKKKKRKKVDVKIEYPDSCSSDY